MAEKNRLSDVKGRFGAVIFGCRSFHVARPGTPRGMSEQGEDALKARPWGAKPALTWVGYLAQRGADVGQS